MDTAAVTPIAIGDAVKVVDENYVEHIGLVVAVHGTFDSAYVPLINAVYISADSAKHDPYGRQVERLSSLQHQSAAKGMPRPGRYWANL